MADCTLRRVDVALSFPGEVRDLVGGDARILAGALGEVRVLSRRQISRSRLSRTESRRGDVDLLDLYSHSVTIVAILGTDYQLRLVCGLEARKKKTDIVRFYSTKE